MTLFDITLVSQTVPFYLLLLLDLCMTDYCNMTLVPVWIDAYLTICTLSPVSPREVNRPSALLVTLTYGMNSLDTLRAT